MSLKEHTIETNCFVDNFRERKCVCVCVCVCVCEDSKKREKYKLFVKLHKTWQHANPSDKVTNCGLTNNIYNHLTLQLLQEANMDGGYG